MRLFKKIVTAFLILFIAIQFIQPQHNIDNRTMPLDISMQYSTPANVDTLLKTACYDCHSNNTRYPWYAYIQPMGWILAGHVKNGKADLNFNEFGGYSKRQKLSKLKSIAARIKDGSMPLASYAWMHDDAKLSAENRILIINWATQTRDSLQVNN